MLRPKAGIPPAAVGEVIERKYRVDRIIGQGGMGHVVAAWHLRLDEPVALKFLRNDVLGCPGVATRFEREAKAAAKIKGEHVCRVLDVGHCPKHGPYMVMEYLEGQDLGTRLEQGGPLPVDTAVGFVLQACEALAEAHVRGIVHRDLKPSNLFLTKHPSGQPLVKLLDFGISKSTEGEGQAQRLTVTDMVMGSFAYMSPEHIRNVRDVDARTDVWALGVILFELLTAELPFPAQTQSELIAKISADPPVPLRARRPDAPAALEAIILRCLKKDVDRRYENVAELTRALAPFASDCEGLVESILRIVGVTLPVRARAQAAALWPEPVGGATTVAPDSDEPTDVLRAKPQDPARPTLASAGAAPQGIGTEVGSGEDGQLTGPSSSDTTLPLPEALARRSSLARPAPKRGVGAVALDLGVPAGSTAASWTPSRLGTLGTGRSRRWVGAVAVRTVLAAAGTAVVLMTLPSPDGGVETAPGVRHEPPPSSPASAGTDEPAASERPGTEPVAASVVADASSDAGRSSPPAVGSTTATATTSGKPHPSKQPGGRPGAQGNPYSTR